MGGQNHQPCNRGITAASAWLSQKVGEGFIEVLSANNHLENAIILGMNKLHVEDVTHDIEGTVQQHIVRATETLKQSLVILKLIPPGFQRLLDVSHKIGYKGNPFADQLDSYELEKAFEGKLILPNINKEVWTTLHTQIKKKNILETLSWESKQFECLVPDIEALVSVMEECNSIATNEGYEAFVNAIENNEVPLRQLYARVFSQWNYLHAMFLYSALIMTELFYQLNNYPSLLDFYPETKKEINAA